MGNDEDGWDSSSTSGFYESSSEEEQEEEKKKDKKNREPQTVQTEEKTPEVAVPRFTVAGAVEYSTICT